jgi:hypothetical protein
MSSIRSHGYSFSTPRKTNLTICTQIKEYGLSYRDRMESLTLHDHTSLISPLPLEKKCPSPPRHRNVPAFCWSHAVQ